MGYKVGTVLIDIKADTAQLVKGMHKAEKNIQSATTKIKYAIGAIAAAWATMEAALKFKELGMSFVETAAKFEQFSVALKSIEGNSKVAQKSMQWIQDFAAKTPYQLDQVTESFIKLRAYGLNAQKDLVWLGNTASAMGKPLNQAVEAIADAVNGEFERLKEFGVKGYQQGNKAALQWTTRSGEVKNIVIENNSKIIESTLKAIWNSKYAGAMQEQSLTWNGILSTMQGNWEIFKNNIMKAGLFDYLKAIVMVVGDYFKEATDNSGKNAKQWANVMISYIKNIITAVGGLIDSFTNVKIGIDYIKLGWLSFKGLVLGTAAGLEDVFATIYNGWVKLLNLLPGNNYATINPIKDGWYNQAFQENLQEIGNTTKEISNLSTSPKTDSIINTIFSKIDSKLTDIKTNKTSDTVETDFSDADALASASNGSFSSFKSPKTPKIPAISDNLDDTIDNLNTNLDDALSDTNDIIDDTTNALSDTKQALSDFNNTMYSDNNNLNTYTVVSGANDNLEHFNDTVNNVDNAVKNATTTLKKFAFAFSDKLISSLSSSADKLNDISAQTNSIYKVTYKEALDNMLIAKNNLINNPLDVNAGDTYSNAFNQLVSSASDYLQAENFSNSADYNFAQATVNTQIQDFKSTASNAYTVLDSMNDFLASINKAFEDGILTNEEKAVISNVANNVNTNNNALLGDKGTLSSTLKGIDTSVNSQTYYDNTGLALDSTFTTSTGLKVDNSVADVSDLMKDKSFVAPETDISSTIKGITYYDNTGLATSSDLTGKTNSVSDYISKLMGDATSGITLSSISSSLPELAVDTNLDENDLSNIDASTASTINAINSVTEAIASKDTSVTVNSTCSGSTSSSTSSSTNSHPNITKTVDYGYKTYDATTNSYVFKHDYREVTYYWDDSEGKYMMLAKGGFTGAGLGKIDETGFRQAGIVHEGEWVAPKWMIEKQPDLFNTLEKIRQSNSFANGGFTSQRIVLNNKNNTNNNEYIEKELKKTNAYLFMLASEIKSQNKILKRVTNNGDAMVVEVLN